MSELSISSYIKIPDGDSGNKAIITINDVAT